MAKYQQYEEYKDSKIESLGMLPSHWVVKSLSKATKRISVGLATSVTEYYRDEGIPIIRNMNIKEGYFDGSDMLYLDPKFAKANSGKVVFKGDVIAVHTGSNLGLACIVPDEFNNCHTFTTLIVTTHKYLLNRYLTYCINSAYGKAEVNRLKFGFGKDNLNVKEFNFFYTILPEFDEQLKIANFLDHETAQIDTLIEKQQTLIQLLKEKRQAVISHAVTPNKDEESAKLGYFIDVLSGYSFPSAGYQAEAKGNTALLRGINVGVGALKWDETVWWSRTDRDGLEAFELEEGDIVFGMDRPWISAGARVAEVTKSDLPCLLLQRVIRIRANKNTYQPFIKLCLASKEFKFSVEADLTGVSVPHISPDQVKSFPIRDIGYEQQKLITDDAFKKMKVLDLIEDSAEQAIQLMQERRTALISAAVTGKIDVRGWQAAGVEA